MEAQKVDMFLIANSKYFESNKIPYIRERLLQMDDSKFFFLHSLNYKDPTMMILVSVLLDIWELIDLYWETLDWVLLNYLRAEDFLFGL